ncbi:MAG: ABC transporter permease [Aggregatilineaceae bacterium]
MASTARQRVSPVTGLRAGALWRYALDLLPAVLAPVVGVLLALLVIVLILEWQGADPQVAWRYVYEGTLESAAKRADLVAFWMPLAMTSFGLVLTYTAGLWNIGVEGQVIMGAIGATWAVRLFAESKSPPLGLQLGRDGILTACFVFAAIAGALWAVVAAVLKTRGGVNEIFGGVALNFIAQTFNMYLISNGGPWQPPGSRATETARFPEIARLPVFAEYRRLSPTTIYLTVIAFIVVFLIMYISHWGLQLRAQGRNRKSAFLLGVRTERNTVLAMALCGTMAGLAGAFRVLAPDVIKLTATPSGGIGFLAILVVLLASVSLVLTPFVSFVFAVLSKGGQRLESGFQWDYGLTLDRSLVRVLQSTVVLMVVLAFGARNRLFPPRSAQPQAEDEEEIDRT